MTPATAQLDSNPSYARKQPVNMADIILTEQKQIQAKESGKTSNHLFTELEDIFRKNKKWMEEQKDREIVIKKLAD